MNIQHELENAWQKARSFPGTIDLLEPANLESAFAAQIIISLLQSTYANHAISRDPNKVRRDIKSGLVKPWIVTRDNQPVACAALIKQSDGTSELGRAVSIENGSGAGKIAMLSAAISSKDELVAEVRLADCFGDIPSGEATQKICFEILGLVPHAIIPAFAHGEPLRNEVFAFASENAKLSKRTITACAFDTLTNRDGSGTLKRIDIVSDSPFRVAIPSEGGQDLDEFAIHSRFSGAGCTMVAAEVTDQNLATITWLREHDFIVAGLDRNVGLNGLPVILLATLGHGTLLAPTKAGGSLPSHLQSDIHEIANKFNRLVGGK